MNQHQILVLHNAIIADSTSNALLQAPNVPGLVAHLNTLSAPDFWVWKDQVDVLELIQHCLDWNCIRDMTDGQRGALDMLFKVPFLDFTLEKVRTAIEVIFTGDDAWAAVRASIYTKAKRLGNIVERLGSTGLGSEASPGVPIWQGILTDWDVTYLVYKNGGPHWTVAE